jgi:cytochrome oxidase Cu insertion factor (SCO1/SenC/PrrC family)
LELCGLAAAPVVSTTASARILFWFCCCCDAAASPIGSCSFHDCEKAQHDASNIAIQAQERICLRAELRKSFMEKGDTAPDFSLSNENGETVHLKDFRGKDVILFFYPKANTPG